MTATAAAGQVEATAFRRFERCALLERQRSVVECSFGYSWEAVVVNQRAVLLPYPSGHREASAVAVAVAVAIVVVVVVVAVGRDDDDHQQQARLLLLLRILFSDCRS